MDDHIKDAEMGRTCRMNMESKICIQSIHTRSSKGRDYFGLLNIDGKIILKWRFEKQIVRCALK
jgi:hypothetical protein